MFIICLTGGAGSGKTYISKILTEKFNIPVIDSDSVAKELMNPGTDVFNNVVKTFGNNTVNENGFLDRKKLAEIVFSDKDRLEMLNSITHPATIEEINRRVRNYEQQGFMYVFIESAIALESGYANFCDEFWYVYSDEDTRRRRLLDRGYSDEKISEVMSSQKSEEYFKKNCQVILDNSKDVPEEVLCNRIKRELELFIDKHSLM